MIRRENMPPSPENPHPAQIVLRTARLPFLILSPVCVFLGLACALASGLSVDYGRFALILLAAVSAHVSINTLNEYQDFKSGLDFLTRRTPFSGGSGALVAQPQLAAQVFLASAVALFITLLVGGYFIWLHGLPVALVGTAGVILILGYTTHINRLPWLCLLSPGLGFGILMVNGSHYLLSGEFSLMAGLASLQPFFLVNNLLLLNQYPDLEADKKCGRRHFPIVYGIRVSNLVYAAFLLATCLVVAIGIGTALLPRLTIIALPPMLLSLYALHGAIRHHGEIGNHPKYLGANAAATVIAPLLLGIGILLG